MTQQPLRELAKQGNVKALALLLQVGLQTQGLTVKAAIQKGSLLIFIESDEIPEEQTSVKFIRHNLMDLGLIFFHLVKIYGRRRGAEEQAWNHEFEIEAKSNSHLPIGCNLRKAKSQDKPEIKKLVLQYASEGKNTRNNFLSLIPVVGVAILIYFAFTMEISPARESASELNLMLLKLMLIFTDIFLASALIFIFFGLKISTLLPNFDISGFWVIEYERKIIAFGELKQSKRFLHINKLFVSPTWRRRGLGSVLVKRFMEETNQPLYVISLQKLAKFYTRLGFVTWLSSAAIITLVYEDK
jgi:N-acetylglutamate synthase-like GNAT family acetyltransferase